MSIVDLRGGERDPRVLSLLDPDPAWMLVGWSRGDALVACAGLERCSEDELAIRALGAHEDSDAELLGAIADVATAARLVAEADERLASLYRS